MNALITTFATPFVCSRKNSPASRSSTYDPRSTALAQHPMFSVIHSVLLRPFPYLKAERMTSIWNDYGSAANPWPTRLSPTFAITAALPTNLSSSRRTGRAGAASTRHHRGDETTAASHCRLRLRQPLPIFGVNPLLEPQTFLPKKPVLRSPERCDSSYGFLQRSFAATSTSWKFLRYYKPTSRHLVGVLRGISISAFPPETLLLRDSEAVAPGPIPYDKF